MYLEKNLTDLFTWLQTPRRIVLVAHTRPDADAMGSCLAMRLYLEKLGHQARVIVPDDFPSFLNWMNGATEVLNHQKNPKTCFAVMADSDLICCLDFNALSRIDALGADIAKLNGKKLAMIDHHRDPDTFADFILWSEQASSTCELVFTLIEKMNNLSLIDQNLASMLYAGMAMDTGIFQYSNTTARVHILAAQLIECGIDVETIHQQLLNQFGENRLRFMGYLLQEKLLIWPELNAACMTVTMADAERFKLAAGDKEGVVNLPLAMKDVHLAVLLTEDKDRIKMSFRSKGTLNVDLLARTYFNGGGHRNASGGSTKKTLEETVQFLQQCISEFVIHNNINN